MTRHYRHCWRSTPAAILAAVAIAGATFPAPAAAQALALPPPPAAGLVQRLDAALPLEMALVDEEGQAVRLGQYFGDGRPVLLVLGYCRCPQLCGLLMHGLLEALQASQAPRRSWRIVGVSIDPHDTPASARSRRELDRAYAQFLLDGRAPAAPLDLHLLIASGADSARLARLAGFAYSSADAPAPASGAPPARFAHPAAVIVATPQGRISRYLMGVSFEPVDIRSALLDASGARIGGLSSRIALLCAHFDPQLGRHSSAIMDALRAVGVVSAALLAAWCWRRRLPPNAGDAAP